MIGAAEGVGFLRLAVGGQSHEPRHGLQDRSAKLPGTLRAQLHDFRRRVWAVKTAEAVFAAAFVVAAAFLAMFALDRRLGHPRLAPARACSWRPCSAARPCRGRCTAGSGEPPARQLARLLGRTHPHAGDQLLGVIELVRSDWEQARSRRSARPRSGRSPTTPAGATSAVPCRTPGIGSGPGCWPSRRRSRWGCSGRARRRRERLGAALAPWKTTPRYTFAAVEPCPRGSSSPHGEPFRSPSRLGDTAWQPGAGEARFGDQPPVVARAQRRPVEFALPPQIAAGLALVRVGDSPPARPDRADLATRVDLGLRRRHAARVPRPPGAQRKDVRSGAVSLVKGSRAPVRRDRQPRSGRRPGRRPPAAPAARR